jgi:hypothetical protein
MVAFLREVREQYDIVLIDTPPVLPVTDSAVVAAQADGVILVYQAGKVGRLVLKRAKVHLESARANVWGVVLNDVQAEIAGSATYTHYYGEEAGGGPARWWERVAAAVSVLAGGRGDENSDGPGDEPGASPSRASGSRYRHVWPGVAALLVLAGVLAGVLSWRMGWLGVAADLRDRAGRPHLGERLTPARDAAPPTPADAPAGIETAVARGGQAPRGLVVLGAAGACAGILAWLARGRQHGRTRYRHVGVGVAIALLVFLIGGLAGALSWRIGQRAATGSTAPTVARSTARP